MGYTKRLHQLKYDIHIYVYIYQAFAYEACDRTRTPPHTPKTLASLVWLRKLQGMWQIARLKQQRSLSFIFCETPRSYEKIMCIYLLFHWFNGENCIVRCSHRRCSIQKDICKVHKIHGKTQGQNLFFNKFAGAADVFTYYLNLKIFEHTL